MNFGDKLATKRREVKKTQLEMANEIGISLTAYKNYESGKNQPTIENAIKIADALEMSIDELCGRWETTHDEKMMIRMKKLSKLNTDEIKIISTIIECMLIRHYAKNVLTSDDF